MRFPCAFVGLLLVLLPAVPASAGDEEPAHTAPKPKQLVESVSKNAILLAASPDGKLLATGGLDGVVDLWSTVDGRHVRRIQAHDEAVSSMAFVTKPLWIVTASVGLRETDAVRVWDVKSGKRMHAFHTAGELSFGRASVPITQISCTAVAGAKNLVAIAQSKRVEVERLKRGFKSEAIATLPFTPWSMAFTSDGKLLLAQGYERNNRDSSGPPRPAPIVLWDLRKERAVWSRKLNEDSGLNKLGMRLSVAPKDAVFYIHPTVIASGSKIAQGDLADGKLNWVAGADSEIHDLAVSPRGRALALATEKSLAIRSPADGSVLRGLANWERTFSLVAFSPDGLRLYELGAKTGIRVWTLSGGK